MSRDEERDAIGDDTEGHGRFRMVEAAEEGDVIGDDTEGHIYVPKDERVGGSTPDGDDDLEGHAKASRI